MLLKKLFRTLWQYKAQFISMVIMIALGVGVFLGFNQKIQMFFRDLSLRGETESYLKEHFPDISITSAVVNNLEINDRYATKGNALLALASYLGIDPAETMAFGDDLNDVSMLKAAGIGVAMGNASDPVKAVADKVTASCDEDGVSTAIQAVVWRENLP